MWKLLTGLTLSWALVLLVNADDGRNYELIITKAQCFHNSTHIKFFECILRNDSLHKYTIDTRLELATDFDAFHVRTSMTAYRKYMPHLQLYDITMNGCEFLETSSKHKIFSVFQKTLNRHLNAMPQCPFPKDFNYTINGFYCRVEDYPKYLPDCEFETENYVIFRSEIVAAALFSGHVTHLISNSNSE